MLWMIVVATVSAQDITEEDKVAANKIDRCLQDARKNKQPYRGCIGIIQKTCSSSEQAQTTLGIAGCYQMAEIAWDILLNRYASLLEHKQGSRCAGQQIAD